MAENVTGIVNGIDVDYVRDVIKGVAAEPDKFVAGFKVSTHWGGDAMKCESKVESWSLGGQPMPHSFTIVVDEPTALLGRDEAPNPQEVLMAALNSCVLMGYVGHAALRGVKLEKVVVETEGNIDMRGMFQIDPSVKQGYETIRYRVRIKGNGTPEQFQEIHEAVCKTSPNYYNISNPIKLEPKLIIE